MKKPNRPALIVSILSVLLCVLFLSGCTAKPDGSEIRVREKCVKGVVYYVTGYKLAPAFKSDGTLFTCDI